MRDAFESPLASAPPPNPSKVTQSHSGVDWGRIFFALEFATLDLSSNTKTNVIGSPKLNPPNGYVIYYVKSNFFFFLTKTRGTILGATFTLAAGNEFTEENSRKSDDRESIYGIDMLGDEQSESRL